MLTDGPLGHMWKSLKDTSTKPDRPRVRNQNQEFSSTGPTSASAPETFWPAPPKFNEKAIKLCFSRRRER